MKIKHLLFKEAVCKYFTSKLNTLGDVNCRTSIGNCKLFYNTLPL